MKTRTLLVAALALSSLPLAQGSPIAAVGPFTGTDQEGLDGKTLDPTTWCIVERAFNNQADICPMITLPPAFLTSWGVVCLFSAHSGSFLVSKGSGFSVSFDTPVTRFGGQFLCSGFVPDGVADFYDPSGQLITSLPINAPNDCSWNWNGWQVQFGSAIGRVDVYSNEPSGEYLAIDSLEGDFSPAGTLSGTPDQVSLSLGGSQVLSMGLDLSQAGKSYLVLGSASGTAPGIPYGGALVPLNVDAYLIFTLLNPNSPILSGSGGVLDGTASATATFTLPPLSDPSLAGLQVHHAGFSLELGPGGFVLPEVTNAVPVTFVP